MSVLGRELGREPEPEQTCALRALMLCDGQVLEETDHALTACACAAEPERIRRASYTMTTAGILASGRRSTPF